MLPWVVLGFMLIISLLLTVIYTGIIFIIDELYVVAVVWFVVGLIITGKQFYSQFENILRQIVRRTCPFHCFIFSHLRILLDHLL